MSEPEGRGRAWTEERGTSDEGRRRLAAPRGLSGKHSVGPVDRDEQTAAFFDGTAAGQLLLRRCAAGHFSEPPVTQCTTCGRLDLEWAAASGGASLVSWAVSWSGDVVTVLVIAELDEGPWWWSQLTGADPGALTVGARLRLAFARPDPGPDDPVHDNTVHEAVPVFELAN